MSKMKESLLDDLPEINWDRIHDVSDVILPEPFPDHDVDGTPSEVPRLDQLPIGMRVVDQAGQRFRLLGWGSAQGSVILHDRYRRQFHADGSMRLTVVA